MAELDAYYTTFCWMSSDEALGLKGSELQAYALVHSYSRNEGGCYYGSLETTSQICGFSRGTAKSALKSLVEKGLLIKKMAVIDGVNRCIYTAVPWGGSKIDPVQNLTGGGSKIDPVGRAKIAPNNKDIYNKSIKKSVDTSAPLILPFSSDRFRETWEALCEEKEWAKKSRNALQIALEKLGRYDEAFAIELMEKAIEKGWKGVVFDDTDAKYQEWKSARQFAIDNQMPRTAQATKPKPPQKDSLIDAMYERMRKQREEEERQMREQIEQFKAQSSDSHGNANTPSDGHDDR